MNQSKSINDKNLYYPLLYTTYNSGCCCAAVSLPPSNSPNLS